MPKALNADWNLAQALFVQGVPYAAIAAKVCVTEAALRQRAHRYGWRDLRTQSVMAVSQSVTGHTGKTLVARSQEVRSALADEIGASVSALRQTPVDPTLEHLDQRVEVTSKLAGASGKVFGWEAQDALGGRMMHDNMAEMDRLTEMENTITPVGKLP